MSPAPLVGVPPQCSLSTHPSVLTSSPGRLLRAGQDAQVVTGFGVRKVASCQGLTQAGQPRAFPFHTCKMEAGPQRAAARLNEHVWTVYQQLACRKASATIPPGTLCLFDQLGTAQVPSSLSVGHQPLSSGILSFGVSPSASSATHPTFLLRDLPSLERALFWVLLLDPCSGGLAHLPPVTFSICYSLRPSFCPPSLSPPRPPGSSAL